MGVDEAERDGEVAVAARLDKRDQPVVPADLDRCFERQTVRGQRGEALGDGPRTRAMTQPRPGQPQREPGDARERC